MAELAPEPIPRLCQIVCGKRLLWLVGKRLLWLVGKRVTEAEGGAAAGQKEDAVKRWERSNH